MNIYYFLRVEINVIDRFELVQIRSVFGGNIMSETHTSKHRPQMTTVRYKVMQDFAHSQQKLCGKPIPTVLI